MAGFKGITLSMSDGCDSDTVTNVFEQLFLTGYYVQLNGIPVLLLELTEDDAGRSLFKVRPVDDNTFSPCGQPYTVPFDEIVSIYIY